MGCLLSPKSLLVADPTRIGWALRGDERTLGAQGYHAKQVVNQHVPQHDRLDLLQTTDQKLLKSPVTARRVGPFRLTTLFVFLLRLGGSHPLTPSRHPRRVARLGSVRVFAPLPFLFHRLHRGKDRHPSLAHTFQILMAGEAAVHIILRTLGQRGLVRFDVLHHRFHLAGIAADVDHLRTDNDQTVQVGALNIVSGTRATLKAELRTRQGNVTNALE